MAEDDLNAEYIRQLRAVVIDFIAMAEHKADGRPNNWDGSTQGQLRALIRDARNVLNREDSTYGKAPGS